MSIPINTLRWAGNWSPSASYFLYDVVLDTSVGNQYVYMGKWGSNTTAPSLNPLVWIPYPPAAALGAAYGSFISNTPQLITQSNINIPITHDMALFSQGVTPVGPAPFSQIQVAQAGAYKISYSVQLDEVNGGNNPINIFPVINGAPMPDSNSQTIQNGQNDEVVMMCEYLLQLPANATVGWIMNGANGVVLQAIPGVGGANPIPQTPSVITTIYRIA